MRLQGILKTWNDDKGFGFIVQSVGGPQVFVHVTDFPRGGRRPVQNEAVSYVMTLDKQKKPRAQKVRFVDAASATPFKRFARVTTLLTVVAFSALLAVFYLHQHLSVLLLAAYALMSLLTFSVYGLDKAAAKAGRRRTPENILHLLELACGWPGALIAQKVFRHKTKKRKFRIYFWLAVLVNLATLSGLLMAAQPLGLPFATDSLQRLLHDVLETNFR